MLLNVRSPVAIVAIGLFLVIVILGFSSESFDLPFYLTDVFPQPQNELTPTNDGALMYLNPQDHTLRDARTIQLQWNITKAIRAPDGVNKTVYLINGQFPGPTIEARTGDTLAIEVRNQLPAGETTSIHWHGLRLRGANRMDGAVGITQDGIPSGESFHYTFHLSDDDAGTFWYHSHSELQRADGLYGGLIVHEPASAGATDLRDQPVHEALIMAGDWYHRSAEEVQASYVSSRSWGMEPVPDSLLLNGQGAFNCASAVPARPVECTQRASPFLGMRQGTHRIRLINVGAMSGITVSAPSLRMLPIAVDGAHKLSQQTGATSIGILYPGERVDVITEQPESLQDQDILSIGLDDENFTLQNKALTSTHHFPLLDTVLDQDATMDQLHSHKRADYLDLSEVHGATLSDGLPAMPNQTVLVYATVNIIQHLGNVPMGFINRTSWAPQSDPQQPLIELPREQFDRNQLVPLVSTQARSHDEHSSNTDSPFWVDLVIDNIDDKGHPFHLHGFDFFVLQVWKSPRGRYRTYNPYQVSADTGLPSPPGGPYNLANPLKKDTVYIPPMGYAVLRIKADNPGLWFLHCHILWHQGTGMAMALQVE